MSTFLTFIVHSTDRQKVCIVCRFVTTNRCLAIIVSWIWQNLWYSISSETEAKTLLEWKSSKPLFLAFYDLNIIYIFIAGYTHRVLWTNLIYCYGTWKVKGLENNGRKKYFGKWMPKLHTLLWQGEHAKYSMCLNALYKPPLPLALEPFRVGQWLGRESTCWWLWWCMGTTAYTVHCGIMSSVRIYIFIEINKWTLAKFLKSFDGEWGFEDCRLKTVLSTFPTLCHYALWESLLWW